MTLSSPSSLRHSLRLNLLLREARAPAQVVVAQEVSQQVVEVARGLEVAAPDRAGERLELGPPGRQLERRLLDRERAGQGLGLDREIPHVHRAARRDPVVLSLVHPGHPGPHRRIGRDAAGQLLHPIELDGASDVGEVHRAGEPGVHVGVGDRRPQHEPGVYRVLPQDEVQPAQVHHRAVGAAAGIRDAEVEEDVARRERQVGVAEGRVVHLGAEGERGERVVAVVALDPAGQRRASPRSAPTGSPWRRPPAPATGCA